MSGEITDYSVGKGALPFNAVSFLRSHAESKPGHPAIITNEVVVTYRQLWVTVGIVATHLKLNGISPGDVVGISMAQTPLHLMTILALAQIGAVSLPIHPLIPIERRQLAAKRFGAQYVVSAREELRLPGLPFLFLGNLSLDGNTVKPERDFFAADINTPLRIAITSGTSGDPKGILLTHGLTSSRANRPDAELSGLSRTLVIDLNFVVGMRPALSALAKGTTVVIARSMSAEHLLHAIVCHHVTRVNLSPAQVSLITDLFAEEGIHCPSLASLRVVGGSLTENLLDWASRTLTPNVYAGYGSSESSMVSWAAPEMLRRHPGTVGDVCPWATVEVVDELDRTLPPGTVGQLRIRSEDQVSGYFMDEARTQKHFRDGWFYPGDLGYMDAEGLLYIEGRADEQLNLGGFKVNPEDIDATLAAHPAVADVGAFAWGDGDGNELLAVALVLRTTEGLDAIKAHAQEQLGPLAPAHFFVTDRLPRTVTGKLRRGELTALLSKSAPSQ